MKSILPFLLCLPLLASAADEKSWTIEGPDAWKAAIESADGIAVDDAGPSPSGKSGTILTKIQKFDSKRSAKSLTLKQSAIWQNWNPIENLGPANLGDAPVLLTMGPNDYWMFGRYGGKLVPELTADNLKFLADKFNELLEALQENES